MSLSDQLIDGLVVTIFKDIGPAVIYNSAKMDEGSAFNLAVKGMTTIGETITKEIYGPFPVPQDEKRRALAFVFTTGATETEDVRIMEFGRTTVFWIIYQEERNRNIKPITGLIKAYLSMLTSRIKSEADLTETSVGEIDSRLRDIISERIRVFGVFDAGKYKEFYDDAMLEATNALIVADENKKVLYVLMLKEGLGPIAKRHINQRAEDINRENYRRGLTKYETADPLEINTILSKYRLTKLWVR
ncbi:MAG: hypothetical protein ACFFBD_10555 [Candidatus Hodarchaeota archaeon]